MSDPRTGREHDLVLRARAGDVDALRALLEEHEAGLRRRLDRGVPPPLRRRVSVADVLQETWLVAFRRIAEFEDRGDGAFEAWIAAIADNKLREALRRHLLTEKRAGGREVTRGARPNSSAFRGREPSPSEVAIGEETRVRAEQALAALPDDHREVLGLVQIEGLTLADAAVRMGRSYEATKKLYGRAASKLAKGMTTGRDL